MLLSRIAPAGALLFLSTIAGCAVTAAPNEDTLTGTEALSSETFKLYSDVEPDPSGRCDFYTVLTLSARRETEIKDPLTRSGAVLDAHLYDEAVGYCKMRIDPNPRDYTLLYDRNECGSTIYSAATTVDGRARDITVTDHRNRVCKNVVPGRIVVEEREESGDLRTFHSFDGKKVLPVS